MEEQFEQTSVVEAPVDGGQQVETNFTPETHTATPTGVEADVAGQQQSNPGEAIKAEIARREAKLKQQYQQYEERAKQAETYQQHLERLARYHGLDSTDALLQAIEESERAREIEAEARRLGVDPSVIQEYVQPMKTEVNTLKEKLAQYERQETDRLVTGILNDMNAKYPDFKDYQQEALRMAANGYDIEHAYIVLTHENQIKQAKLQAEQEALQKLQTNAATSTGPLGNEGAQETFGYSSMSPTEKRALRERVKRGL